MHLPLQKLNKAIQLGERDPKAGNRVRDSPSSCCWRSCMRTKIYICCMCVWGQGPFHACSLAGGSVSVALQPHIFKEFFCPVIICKGKDLVLILFYEYHVYFSEGIILTFSPRARVSVAQLPLNSQESSLLSLESAGLHSEAPLSESFGFELQEGLGWFQAPKCWGCRCAGPCPGSGCISSCFLTLRLHG